MNTVTGGKSFYPSFLPMELSSISRFHVIVGGISKNIKLGVTSNGNVIELLNSKKKKKIIKKNEIETIVRQSINDSLKR